MRQDWTHIFVLEEQQPKLTSNTVTISRTHNCEEKQKMAISSQRNLLRNIASNNTLRSNRWRCEQRSTSQKPPQQQQILEPPQQPRSPERTTTNIRTTTSVVFKGTQKKTPNIKKEGGEDREQYDGGTKTKSSEKQTIFKHQQPSNHHPKQKWC